MVGVVILIVTGLLMFTYKSTAFNLEGFILVLSASVITGLRWSCAQITIQKEQLGVVCGVSVCVCVCVCVCVIIYVNY